MKHLPALPRYGVIVCARQRSLRGQILGLPVNDREQRRARRKPTYCRRAVKIAYAQVSLRLLEGDEHGIANQT